MYGAIPADVVDSKQDEEISFPINNFFCPITQTLLVDPVITPKGISYSKKAIEQWLQTKQVCPSTGESLQKEQLINNKFLANLLNKKRLIKDNKSNQSLLIKKSSLMNPMTGKFYILPVVNANGDTVEASELQPGAPQVVNLIIKDLIADFKNTLYTEDEFDSSDRKANEVRKAIPRKEGMPLTPVQTPRDHRPEVPNGNPEVLAVNDGNDIGVGFQNQISINLDNQVEGQPEVNENAVVNPNLVEARERWRARGWCVANCLGTSCCVVVFIGVVGGIVYLVLTDNDKRKSGWVSPPPEIPKENRVQNPLIKVSDSPVAQSNGTLVESKVLNFEDNSSGVIAKLFETLKAHLPSELRDTMLEAVKLGVLSTFLLTLTEDFLSKHLTERNYKPEQIFWMNQAVKTLSLALVFWATGAAISSAAVLPACTYLLNRSGTSLGTASNTSTYTSIALNFIACPVAAASSLAGAAIGHRVAHYVTSTRPVQYCFRKGSDALQYGGNLAQTGFFAVKKRVVESRLGAAMDTAIKFAGNINPFGKKVVESKSETPVIGARLSYC